MIGRNDRHGFQQRIVQTFRYGVLDKSLLQLKTGTGHGQVLIALGDFCLGAQNIHLRNALQFQLLPRVIKRLLRERRRFFVNLRLFVGADQIPINIFDLGDGSDHLVFKSDVGDFFVVAGDTQITQVRPQAESGEKLLLNTDTILPSQSWRQSLAPAIGGLASVVETEGKTRACRKGLLIVEVKLPAVGLQCGHAVENQVRKRKRLMLFSAVRSDERIVGRHRRSGSESGLHQSRSASSGPACAAAGTARAGAWSARTEASNAATGGSLHHASVDAAKESAGLCAQNVCVGDRKIVASNGQIQIIFERKINGILEREIEFAIAD